MLSGTQFCSGVYTNNEKWLFSTELLLDTRHCVEGFKSLGEVVPVDTLLSYSLIAYGREDEVFLKNTEIRKIRPL